MTALSGPLVAGSARQFDASHHSRVGLALNTKHMECSMDSTLDMQWSAARIGKRLSAQPYVARFVDLLDPCGGNALGGLPFVSGTGES